MNNDEVRLVCLQIAASSVVPTATLLNAQHIYDWVTGKCIVKEDKDAIQE